jgi:hypothetical protein
LLDDLQSAEARALASPKQVSLEILPSSCLAHQDLDSFFVATADSMVTAAAAATAAELSCSSETLAERCLSLDDLRPAPTPTGGGPQQAATSVRGDAHSKPVTYALHPLLKPHPPVSGGCTQKKVILEERPVTPHTCQADKIYLHL